MGGEVCDVALGPGVCVHSFFFCSCVANLVYPPRLLQCSALGAPMLLLTLTASLSLGVPYIGKKNKIPDRIFFFSNSVFDWKHLGFFPPLQCTASIP